MTKLYNVAVAHMRLVMLETVREPMALVGNILIPVLCFCFFVLPNEQITENVVMSTENTLQLAAMVGFSTCLFGYSTSISQDVQSGFGTYLRTLPIGGYARSFAQLVGVVCLTVLGVLLLGIFAVITTAIEVNGNLMASIGALLMTMIMWGFLGATIGVGLSQKAGVTVAQLLFLTLAFSGGMLIPPDFMPERLNDLSLLLPSRAARDLVCQVGGGGGMNLTTLLRIIIWTTVAVLGYIFVARKYSTSIKK